MRYVKYTAIVISILLATLLVTLYVRYGGGKPYPDLSTAPLLDKSQLEKVLEYPENIGHRRYQCPDLPQL